MTRWMAVSEFKALGFCLIHQIQSILRFPCELSLLTTGHSARSEAKSQNLIVILRTVKRSLRIYCRTRDGFCNSGQRCPLCRMTGWMADNVLKNTQFCQIHQLPKKSRFFHQLSLLTPSFCTKQSEVAESNCHSAWSETESQNLSFIKTSAQFTQNCTPSAQFPAWFLNFLGYIKNPKKVYSSIDSVTSIIKIIIQSLFPGKIVSTLL